MRVGILFKQCMLTILMRFGRIVEFASPEDAQRAVRELSETPLLGRPVFIREVWKLRFGTF